MGKRLFFLLFFIYSSGYADDTLRTNVVLDSLGNEVFLIVDNNGQPQKYFSPIYTPVCVDGSCYPINIELHWDLAGNYLNYTLPKNETLTKIEHLPFTDFDYGLLNRMIAKSPSALADFSIYDLTLPGEDKVDGVTGATRPELSGYFVPDALFTTFTLWHLARKPKDALMRITKEKYFTNQWTDFIMTNSVLECRKLFIAELLTYKNEAEQANILFDLMEEYEHSFPLELLKDITDNDETRQKFITLYQKTDNNSIKAVVLGRWLDLGIEEAELMAITNEIGDCANCFSEELKLINEFKNWPENQYEIFYSKTESQRNMMRKGRMNAVLEARVESYPKKFRKMIKRSK